MDQRTSSARWQKMRIELVNIKNNLRRIRDIIAKEQIFCEISQLFALKLHFVPYALRLYLCVKCLHTKSLRLTTRLPRRHWAKRFSALSRTREITVEPLFNYQRAFRRSSSGLFYCCRRLPLSCDLSRP